jgi:hypothetical protein
MGENSLYVHRIQSSPLEAKFSPRANFTPSGELMLLKSGHSTYVNLSVLHISIANLNASMYVSCKLLGAFLINFISCSCHYRNNNTIGGHFLSKVYSRSLNPRTICTLPKQS